MNGDLCGRSRHIHQRKAELISQVLRQLGVDPGLKQHRVRLAVDLFCVDVDVGDFIDFQGRQGQGNQCGDFVAHLYAGTFFQIGADFFDPSDENSTGFAHRVLELAALLDNLQNGSGDFCLVAAALALDAAKGGGGGLKSNDVDQDLVGADHRIIVDFLCSLRQQAGGKNNAVTTVFIPSHGTILLDIELVFQEILCPFILQAVCQFCFQRKLSQKNHPSEGRICARRWGRALYDGYSGPVKVERVGNFCCKICSLQTLDSTILPKSDSKINQ